LKRQLQQAETIIDVQKKSKIPRPLFRLLYMCTNCLSLLSVSVLTWFSVRLRSVFVGFMPVFGVRCGRAVAWWC
jgi:hypothetical protein